MPRACRVNRPRWERRTFIAPAFFLLLFLVAYPFVLSLWFSLRDARVGETGVFIGLENFRRLLASSTFRQTLQNSLVFAAATLGAKTGPRHGIGPAAPPDWALQAAHPRSRAARGAPGRPGGPLAQTGTVSQSLDLRRLALFCAPLRAAQPALDAREPPPHVEEQQHELTADDKRRPEAEPADDETERRGDADQ